MIESKWIGVAKVKPDNRIVAVAITDKRMAMPFGNTDWLEAIDGDSSAIAVVEVGDDNMTVADCATDLEAQTYYYTYEAE